MQSVSLHQALGHHAFAWPRSVSTVDNGGQMPFVFRWAAAVS